jgi:hypothetical protein
MMSERLQLILFNIGLALVVMGLLYWFSYKTEKDSENLIENINKDYAYTTGVITDFKAFKGHSVEVRYVVNNTMYELSIGWDKNPKNLQEGDSIKLRYATEKPELFITELQEEY